MTFSGLPASYDTWRLSSPDEDYEVGTEVGDLCNRYEEPDEDAPRGYKPKPCEGMMVEEDGEVTCDCCGEIV
jgi:hypothetical protein